MKGKEISNITLSGFNSIKSKWSDGTIKLGEALNTNNDKLKQAIKYLRTLEYKSDGYKSLKEKLPCVTISACFNKERRISNFSSYTKLLAIDIDEQDNIELFKSHNIEKIKAELFKLPYVYAASISVGGRGIFLVIPIKNTDYIREYVNAIAHLLKSIGVEIDTCCSDITRLRILSYDEKILIKGDNEEIEEFDKILEEDIEKQKELICKRVKQEYSTNKLTDNDQFCIKAIKACISMNLINDCGRDKSSKDSSTKAYNKWYAHACRLCYLGNEGYKLFRDITYLNGRNYNETEIISKFNEGAKHSSSRDSLAYYFKPLKEKLGKDWITLVDNS